MSLHYHITGSGPTIILLHGFLSDSRYWRGITSSLSQHYRVVTIDLLGFGKSPKPKTATYSLAYQAQLVAKTIKDVSDEPVSILAHSMGALIACQVALDNPARVRKLILSNMPLYASAEQVRDILRQTGVFYRLGLHSPASHVLWPIVKALAYLRVPHRSRGFSPHHTHHSRKGSLTHTLEASDALQLLAQLTTPTHLIVGKYDRSVYQQNLSTFSPPPSLTIEYVDTGHHTPLHRPDIVLRQLI